MSALRFCIVTTAHVCDNPRVVKEADALAAAGHDVRVVSYDANAETTARDAIVMRDRRWRLDALPIHRRGPIAAARWAYAGVRSELSRELFARGVRAPAVRDLAISKHMPRMLARAVREPADVVVAHHAQALPVGARAARALGAALAFDFEDYHVVNVEPGPGEDEERARIAAVDVAFLPQCRTIIASTAPIADALVARYGVSRPTVVVNTFPLAQLHVPTAVRDRRGDAVSFYWFSQVIGPNRGLEQAVRCLARAGVPLALHLRGRVAPGFDLELREIARANGMAGTIGFHPPELPAELVAISAQHDVGLSIEQPINENRMLSAPNKLFTYLLAGNAIIATSTPGQLASLDEAPGAAEVIEHGSDEQFIAAVRRLATSPELLAARKRAAAEAGRRRFNWEHDAPVLVAALERSVG